MAERYGLGHSQHALASHESRTAEVDAAFLLPHLRPGFRILDVGCGPGSITRGFCKYVPDGQVIGIDAAQSVLGKARQSANAAPGGFPKNLDFQCFDITQEVGLNSKSMPTHWEASFDVIYDSQCLIHLADPVAAIKNLKRCLRPGGIMASRGFDPSTFTFWRDPSGGLADWVKLTQILVSEGEGASIHGGREIPYWFQEAGFDMDRLEIISTAITYAGKQQRKWWGQLHAGRFSPGETTREILVQKCGVSAERCDGVRDALLDFADSSDGFFFCNAINVLGVVEAP